MGERAEAYRLELRALTDWESFLKDRPIAPGRTADLDLVEAVGDEADDDRLWRLSASSDEFLAMCGIAGLGRVALIEPATVLTWLRELASDPRPLVREGVMLALRRIGRESMPRLLSDVAGWVDGGPFLQRAAVTALCDPVLLAQPDHAVHALEILDRITTSLAATADRRVPGYRDLRQALAAGWGVAAAAAPANAGPYLEKWGRSTDRDVAWVMKHLETDRQEARQATGQEKGPAKPQAKPPPRPRKRRAAG
jgi:hypothetical protein